MSSPPPGSGHRPFVQVTTQPLGTSMQPIAMRHARYRDKLMRVRGAVYMRVVHFTQGATDPLQYLQTSGTRIVSLASGHGEVHVSCLHLAPGAKVPELWTTHECALLVVHGCLSCIGHGRVEVYAGMGVLPEESEQEYSLETSSSAVVIVVEAPCLVPHVQGTSTHQRTAGQRWPGEPAILPRKYLRLPWRHR